MNRIPWMRSILAIWSVFCGCGTSPPAIPPNDHVPKNATTTIAISAPETTALTASAVSTTSASTIPAPPIQAPTLEWARRWGSFGGDNVNQLVAGPDGTFIVAGGYQFEIDLGGKKLVGESDLQGNGGAFIAGFSQDGQLRWATNFHGKADENISDMAHGPNGTVVFTGGFRDLNAGCGRIRSKDGDDVLIGALAADGHCQWTRGYGAKGNEWGQTLAVDNAGNITAFGILHTGTNFGGGAIDIGDKGGAFVASFTADGTHRWSRSLWSQSIVIAQAAVAATDGTVYVILRFEGTVDFGDGPRTSHGGGDVALLGLAPDGRLLWSSSLGSTGSDAVDGLAVDPRSGDILIAGAFSNTLDLGNDHLTSSGGTDAFVARFDKTGHARWARGFGGIEHDHFSRIALDGAGNLYVLGQMRASFDVGATKLQSNGEEDVFLTSLSPNGSFRWALSFGGPEYDRAAGLVVEPSGRILVAGSFTSNITFGSTQLKSAGSQDIFVAAWRP